MNNVAAAAITFKKAMEPDFREYAARALRNAHALAAKLMEFGVKLVTDGTDNHLMVIDTVQSIGFDGKRAEEALDRIGITTNKQVIPDDPLPPLRPSGLRLGTPACTTRGMDEHDMKLLTGWIAGALRAPHAEATLMQTAAEVRALCERYTLPGL